jgi:2-polyprenyl-6-hydroxyphenyl methylase/3-demethylubiquinone-9 3-methyltransferase
MGAMGDALGKATRERIHWVCSKVKGLKVLDVGCSQGITSIILGREGKIVDGIDIDANAISFAREKLLLESSEVQSNVKFTIADFKKVDWGPGTYDTVILSEILEHFVFPDQIIDWACNMLRPEGRLIVSVPFGINDSLDHKKSYYGIELILKLSTRFFIEERTIIRGGRGQWLCITSRLGNPDELMLNEEITAHLNWLEHGISERERTLQDERIELLQQIKNDKESMESIKKENQKQIAISIGELKAVINNVEKRGALENRLKNLEEELHAKIEILNKKLENANQTINMKSETIAMMSNDAMKTTADIDLLKGELTRMSCIKDQLDQQVLANQALNAKLQQFNNKIALEIRNRDMLERENREIKSKMSDLATRLSKELNEEKRIVRDYSRLEREKNYLAKKVSMFESSITGQMVTRMWKIINKVRNP